MEEYVHWDLCNSKREKGLESPLKKGVDFVQDSWAWSDSSLQWGGPGCELCSLHFLAAVVVQHPLCSTPALCFVYHCSQIAEERDKGQIQDKIKTALEMHWVWQCLEQWWEVKKKSLTLTQESKLMSENLMQHKVWWNKGCWGVSFCSVMTSIVQHFKRNNSVMVFTELYEKTGELNKYHKTCHKSIVLKIY